MKLAIYNLASQNINKKVGGLMRLVEFDFIITKLINIA